MDATIVKNLNDKSYEKRKNAALEVERLIREAIAQSDGSKVRQIVNQLCELAGGSAGSSGTATRNGGIMGLAGASIALGQQHIAPYLGDMAPPILACFHDPDHRVRYFACESMYNVAKVAKGEILVYFNELFDAMSKLAADIDNAVKNGGELLDRLVKDIVIEQASTYVSARPTTPDHNDFPESDGEQDYEKQRRLLANGRNNTYSSAKRAFSLERFVPLLSERIYVINPFTRTYLVSWVTVLDSIPELELVTYLPHFLDGLLKYLGDPTEDIRHATMRVLTGFLREIKEAAEVKKAREEARASKREKKMELKRKKTALRAQQRQQRGRTSDPTDPNEEPHERQPSTKPGSRRQSVDTAPNSSTATTSGAAPSSPSSSRAQQQDLSLDDITEEEHNVSLLNDSARGDGYFGQTHGDPEHVDVEDESESTSDDDTYGEEDEGEGSGAWVPGQGVDVDHAAIVEILLQHLSFPDEEIQATCLRWISEFLLFAKETMVVFTPRLIPVVLSSLAHHVPAIRQAALQTNYNLFKVIQQLPSPPSPSSSDQASSSASPDPSAPAPAPVTGTSPETRTRGHASKESISSLRVATNAGMGAVPFPSVSPSVSSSNNAPCLPAQDKNSLNNLDALVNEIQQIQTDQSSHAEQKDPLDYQATVNALTLQFLNENEETRVAALQWLSMLHQKAPKKILSMHDGTFPALLKTLSDTSEEVIKADLQLLAQISSNSEEDYFPLFMANLLSLFSTDRKLLETRGSLIIRQLCLSLNTERIYKIFADLLEKDEDLEFASIMVQNLHTIMITSPELSDFRKRLKNLETKDGQILFSNLYRSWSHNAVATFSLCLLAQAYEHAANLLQIFADLEVSVSLLIQIDKLVQLLESPVFTSLRLQLLEPERHPYLYKCLYGLLMFLPQSSAFLTLRNRLNAVSPLGFLHVAPRSSSYGSTNPSPGISGRSTIRRADEIKWSELLTHFRQVQLKHERARRNQHGENDIGGNNTSATPPLSVPSGSRSVANAGMRRKGTGDSSVTLSASNRITSGKMASAGMTKSISGGGNSSRPLSPQSQPNQARPTRRIIPATQKARNA